MAYIDIPPVYVSLQVKYIGEFFQRSYIAVTVFYIRYRRAGQILFVIIFIALIIIHNGKRIGVDSVSPGGKQRLIHYLL